LIQSAHDLGLVVDHQHPGHAGVSQATWAAGSETTKVSPLPGIADLPIPRSVERNGWKGEHGLGGAPRHPRPVVTDPQLDPAGVGATAYRSALSTTLATT
jgi:hypothetical protein